MPPTIVVALQHEESKQELFKCFRNEAAEVGRLQLIRKEIVERRWFPGRLIRLMFLNLRIKRGIKRLNILADAICSLNSFQL